MKVPRGIRTRVFLALVAVLAPLPSHAQQTPAAVTAPPAAHADEPFEIIDNSFFVEEAFNQEPGVVQTIFGAAELQDSGWAATLTQEWPVPGERHQLSLTALVGGVNGADGFGDLAINYRVQLVEEGDGRPAIAPRATLLCPTGNRSRGLSAGTWGLQFNVPVSKQVGDMYFHGNAGVTWYPSATAVAAAGGGTGVDRARALTSPFIAGSAIYRLRPMFNLMLESVVTWQDAFTDDGSVRHDAVRILSPGIRGGWNHGESQYVVGGAMPTTWGGLRADIGLFVYLSYEARFWGTKAP